MRRYEIVVVLALVVFLAALRTVASTPVQAAPLSGVDTPTSTATATATPTITPTVVWLFPFVAKMPTLTPTTTPTSSPTPTLSPSPTLPPSPTHPPYTITTGHLSGNISLKDHPQVPQYYMTTEWIKFYEWIHNDSDSTIERYQILGVRVTWPDGVRNDFHTIWTGAPDYIGGIPPGSANCFGPNGATLDWGLPLRCAPDSGSAQTEDHVGASSNIPVDTQGTYTMQYFVCQSTSVLECSNGGEWHKLGDDLQFVAVPPPAEWHVIAPTPTTQEVCDLIMTDAAHGSLKCTIRRPSKSRPGGQH